MRQCSKLRELNEFTVGSKLIEEKLFNPFIRCATEEIYQDLTGETDPVRVFAKIRKFKD